MAESKGSQGAEGRGGKASAKAGSRRAGWRRWRPYSAAVVAVAAVFAVSAAVGANVRSGQATLVKVPKGLPSTGPERLAVPVRPDVPVTVTVYEDLRSPASKAFAAQWGPVFDRLLDGGRAEIAYRLVTSTDAAEGGHGAARAANAAACAQDQGRKQFLAFVDELWAHQPPVGTDRFAGNAYLERLGRKVHGLQASMFVPCVRSRDHRGWVTASQRDFTRAHLGAVPVLRINGTTVDPVKDALTPAKLDRMVDRAAARAVAHPSASASPAGS